MDQKLKAIVIGCGNMGSSHARAYHRLPDYELAGLVDSDPARREALGRELGVTALFGSVEEALAAVKPDVAGIATYPDTHPVFAKQCLEAGCHVFVEKPIALTPEQARDVVETARRGGRKLIVGYILRQHPSWARFIEIARTLGKPLVMRMNLNQQSVGFMWDVHKNLMKSMSPIVDCGVHYVDVMCQMTRSRPVRVQAIGARLTDQIAPGQVNYGCLQVVFEDGSVGWYEAGWGPMMSEEAFFVKDVIGPKGCVSIAKKQAAEHDSSNIEGHTKTGSLRVHYADQDEKNNFTRPDEWIDFSNEPDHQELCDLEQAWLARAIRENLDLGEHWDDAINSLRVVLAADESARLGEVVRLA